MTVAFVAEGMVARYLAKVVYGSEKFSTFFISNIPDWGYNFLTLTDDIKRIPSVSPLTLYTMRIKRERLRKSAGG